MQSQSGGPIRPRYGRTRPTSDRLVVRQQSAVYDNQPKQPLPPATGPAPYHLSLDQVLDPATMQTIQSSQRLVFHTVGDTGGISTAQVTSQINERAVPFIVAGAGGYYHTHILQGTAVTTPYTVQEGLTLEKYCDDRWGCLLMEVTAQTLKGEYIPVPPESDGSSQPFVSFTLNWRTHQLQ
jgi:hypothetical protein